MTTLNSLQPEEHDQTLAESSIEGSPAEYASPPTYVTRRSKRNLPVENESELRRELKLFQVGIQDMLEKWFTKQDQKMTNFIDDIKDIKVSLRFISDKYDDLHRKAETLENRISSLEHQWTSLRTSEPHIKEMEAKLDAMEQQARYCNVEISNLPEKRGENLISKLEAISSISKHPISPQHITSIHRVPQANPKSSRPKNVIVRFTSQILRDNFIAATRLHKGITSDQLDISGPPKKVYINEHLTLKNKTLFREAREEAKKHNYRYVWIKHGTILVREKDTSPVFAIRSREDLLKIKPH